MSVKNVIKILIVCVSLSALQYSMSNLSLAVIVLKEF